MVWWMKYQIWTPILLLQFLNLFWYFLILRIGYRYVSALIIPTSAISCATPTGRSRWRTSRLWAMFAPTRKNTKTTRTTDVAPV